MSLREELKINPVSVCRGLENFLRQKTEELQRVEGITELKRDSEHMRRTFIPE